MLSASPTKPVWPYPHHPEIPKQPTVIYTFSDRDPSLGLSDPEQGTFMTTIDQEQTVPVLPLPNPIRVVPPVSFSLDLTRSTNQRQGPDAVYYHDFIITSNSDVVVGSAHLELALPKGIEVAATPPAFLDGNKETVTWSKSGSLTLFPLGSVDARATRQLRVFLHVKNVGTAASPAVDPDLKKAGYAVFTQPPAVKLDRSSAREPYSRRFAADSVAAITAGTGYASIAQPVPIGDLSGPRFALYRGQPYTVAPEGDYAYTIAFANLGQKTATNVVLAMQVPYGVTFAGAEKGLTQSIAGNLPQLEANTASLTMTNRTDATTIKGSGGGVDIVTWHFASLPPQGVGVVKLRVKAYPGIHDATVADHSLTVKADGVPETVIATNPLGTRVLGKAFANSRWATMNAFLDHQNLVVRPEAVAPVQEYVEALTIDSRVSAHAGMDGLLLNNGVGIFPLTNGQVMAVVSETASGSIAANASGANRLASGDGHTIVAGLASAVTVTGIGTGFDGKSCQDLLASAQTIATQHLGRIIPAGGSNLIALDENNQPVQLSNDSGGKAVAITGSTAGVLDAGANAKILTPDATIVAAGIISHDGGGIISHDGGGLITQDGGGIISHDGGGLDASSTGSGIVSHDSGGIISPRWRRPEFRSPDEACGSIPEPQVCRRADYSSPISSSSRCITLRSTCAHMA